MNKIKLINKNKIKQMTSKECENLSIKILKNIFENLNLYTELEIKKLFKNIYNLNYCRELQAQNGKIFKIQSTGTLKEIKNNDK